jgi:hypothetical protein
MQQKRKSPPPQHTMCFLLLFSSITKFFKPRIGSVGNNKLLENMSNIVDTFVRLDSNGRPLKHNLVTT